MNTRIREVRKSVGLTQREFAERLGMKQNSIALIEGGRPTSEQTILAICREFHIREEWLRTGEGSMREPEAEGDTRRTVPALLASIEAAYKKMPPEAQRQIGAFVDEFIEDYKASQQPAEAPQSAPAGEWDSLPPETDTSGLTASQTAELAEIARQMRLETEAAVKSSHSSAG